MAARTEHVYEQIMEEKKAEGDPEVRLAKCVRNLWDRGPMAGPMMAMLFLFCHYWILLLNHFHPVLS